MFLTAFAQNMCLTCHEEHYERVGACVYCHRGIDKTTRKAIAHYKLIRGGNASFRFDEHSYVLKGKEVIKNAGCRRCHVIGGKGNLLSANIDISVKNNNMDEILKSIKHPVEYMPDFHFDDDQINIIVTALLNEGFDEITRMDYVVVHFEEEKGDKSLFSKKCGNCHKIISNPSGGLGNGRVGPNLSGLYSEYFPNISGIDIWSKEKLKGWLRNPRDIKKTTDMPVLELQSNELKEILEILE